MTSISLSFFSVTLGNGVETRWPPMSDGELLRFVERTERLGHQVVRVIREADGEVFISTGRA